MGLQLQRAPFPHQRSMHPELLGIYTYLYDPITNFLTEEIHPAKGHQPNLVEMRWAT